MKSKSSLLTTALASGLFVLSACAPMAVKPSEYAMAQEFDIGPAGKWDFIALDSLRNRLFVTAGSHVFVVDSRSGKAVGDIANTEGVHGVAMAQDLKLGFTSNGGANSITVFDLETLKTIREVSSGGLNPDALVYDAKTQKLFVMNGRSKDMAMFDAKTMNLLKLTKLSGKPELAVLDDAGQLFVNIELEQGAMDVLSTASGDLKSSWALVDCENPSGLALDKARNRLFSACQNKVMVVTDASNGSRVATIPIGTGPDGVAYDEREQLVFSSNGGDATLTIAEATDVNGYRVRANVKTAMKAKTLVMDSASNRVYMPTVMGERFKVLVVAANPVQP